MTTPSDFPRPARISVQDRIGSAQTPTFGFILLGGVLVGAQVRDIRLANELVRRGYPVHVWWAFDKVREAPLSPAIRQNWLFSAARYTSYTGSWELNDRIGRAVNRMSSDQTRAKVVQWMPRFAAQQIRAVIELACRGVEHDRGLARRFAGELDAAGVTHVLPNLEILALFAEAAREYATSPFKCLVTFQGYEVYANFAREIGCEVELYRRLADVVARSDWPAVAVSDAYCNRIRREVSVPQSQLRSIPPGVPVGIPMAQETACTLVREAFPEFRPDVPLVTYVGRQDSEKGLDLLLYAARLLQHRNVPLQLAICGPTTFGSAYEKACRQIAEHLRVPVLSRGYISDELRSALFRASRTVVYPSIHEEPFGMVPVEAMAQGTPVVVPDVGGIAGVIEVNGSRGGLHFSCWDSGALAHSIESLITNSALHSELSGTALDVAEYFSVERLGERVLAHIGLPAFNDAAGAVQPTVVARSEMRRAA